MANVEVKESGTLKEKSTIARFLELAGSSFKGVLVFGRGNEKRSFIFEDGNPYFPNQILGEHSLGRILFEKNLMTVDQFKKIKEVEASGKTFFQALTESKVIPKNDVLEAILSPWIEDMATVFSWDAGRFACVEFLPKDVTRIETDKKIHHYLFRALIVKNRKMKNKFSPSTRFEIPSVKEVNFSFSDLVPDEVERKIFDALKLSKPIKLLAQEINRPETIVAPIVLSLREMGLAYADTDKKPKIVRPVVAAPAPMDDEFSLNDEKDFVAKIQGLDDLDFFQILGVSREANADDVQARYFMLAKKYHPDRVKAKVAVPIKEIERLFGKITEAYNTLSNAQLRKEYELKTSKEASDHQVLMTKIVQSESLFLDGKSLLNRGVFSGAVDRIREAITLYDQEPEYYVKLGWALFRLAVKDNKPAKIAEAKKILVDAYNQDYLISEVAYYLGMIAKHENKIDQAMNYFRSCLQAEPTHAMASSELRLLEKKKEQGKIPKKK